MRNNKITRRKKMQPVTVQADGTEVLHSRESRAKVRRWSFEADIHIVVPPQKKADSEEMTEKQVLPMRTMKLDAVSYSTAREASHDCKGHEGYLRSTTPMLANSLIVVRAIPHETVSRTTVSQLSGYRDMAMILDKALADAITEAEKVVSGKSLGTQFVQRPAVEAQGESPAVPEYTLASIKEEFYKNALESLKGRQDEGTDGRSGPEQSDGENQASSEGDGNPESFEELRDRLTTDATGASGTEGQVSA